MDWRRVDCVPGHATLMISVYPRASGSSAVWGFRPGPHGPPRAKVLRAEPGAIPGRAYGLIHWERCGRTRRRRCLRRCPGAVPPGLRLCWLLARRRRTVPAAVFGAGPGVAGFPDPGPFLPIVGCLLPLAAFVQCSCLLGLALFCFPGIHLRAHRVRHLVPHLPSELGRPGKVEGPPEVALAVVPELPVLLCPLDGPLADVELSRGWMALLWSRVRCDVQLQPLVLFACPLGVGWLLAIAVIAAPESSVCQALPCCWRGSVARCWSGILCLVARWPGPRLLGVRLASSMRHLPRPHASQWRAGTVPQREDMGLTVSTPRVPGEGMGVRPQWQAGGVPAQRAGQWRGGREGAQWRGGPEVARWQAGAVPSVVHRPAVAAPTVLERALRRDTGRSMVPGPALALAPGQSGPPGTAQARETGRVGPLQKAG